MSNQNNNSLIQIGRIVRRLEAANIIAHSNGYRFLGYLLDMSLAEANEIYIKTSGSEPYIESNIPTLPTGEIRQDQ